MPSRGFLTRSLEELKVPVSGLWSLASNASQINNFDPVGLEGGESSRNYSTHCVWVFNALIKSGLRLKETSWKPELLNSTQKTPESESLSGGAAALRPPN